MASVLVVDDDAGIRESAVRALEKAGHRLFEAGDAAEAQKILREQRVDVVVSDIYMPGQDGLELLQSIVERRDPPRVILMTARGSIETTAIAQRIGAFDYLAKPFELSELIARVGENGLVALKRRSRTNSNALPENRFVPDLVTALTAAPECTPFCALNPLVATLNSCSASGNGNGLLTLLNASLLSPPSITKLFVFGCDPAIEIVTEAL